MKKNKSDSETLKVVCENQLKKDNTHDLASMLFQTLTI